MTMKKAKLIIPREAMQQLNFDEDTPLSMNIHHNVISVRPSNLTDVLPNIKLRWFLIPAALFSLLVFAYCNSRNQWLVPLNGQWSIATYTSVVGVVSGVLSFAGHFITQKVHNRGAAKDFHWRAILPLVIAIGMILAISFVMSFWLLDRIFHGAAFDIYTATVFVFLINAAVNYLMINLAVTISPVIVTNLMTIMVVGGVVGSMMTNNHTDWWKYNFSYLGTQKSSANLEFNVTLVFSALLMMALIDYLFVDLQRKYKQRGVLVLKLLLYGLAATLGGIGLFPNNPEFHVLHDRISMWLIYFMLIMIVFIKRLLPDCSVQFQRLSYIIGAVIAADYIVFKATSYLSLTAFELSSFALAFSWILLLFQNIEALTELGEQIFAIEVQMSDEVTKGATTTAEQAKTNKD